MGNLLKLFGFWGSSDLELPILTNPSSSGISTTTATITASLAYEGSEAPITQIGFVYGTSPNPQLGDPGVTDVQIAIPGSTPAVITANLTGLSDTTTFYWNAYAINGAGTAYLQQGPQSFETDWDALIIQFLNSSPSTNYKIGYTRYANNKSNIKVKGPDGVVHNLNWTGSNIQNYYLDITNWPQGNITMAIAPQTANDVIPSIQWGKTDLRVANCKLLNWGPNKWENLGWMFGFEGNDKTVMSIEAPDHPDLSNCEHLQYCFYFNEYNTQIQWGGNHPNPQFNYDIGQWDVSNVQNFYSMFWGSSLGRYGVVKLDWQLDNGYGFNNMFRDCQQMGLEDYTNPEGGLDLSSWTFGSTQTLDFREMFLGCQNWRPDAGYVGPVGGANSSAMFNLQTGSSGNISAIRVGQMFRNCRFFGTDYGNIDNSKMLALGSFVSTSTFADKLEYMFENIGTLSSGFAFDLSNFDLSNYLEMQYMFQNVQFNATTPYWSTMLANQDWSSNNGTNKNMRNMFYNAANIPPLDNWVLHHVKYLQQMFMSTYRDPSLPALDLSSWKAGIDALKNNSNSNQTIECNSMFANNYGDGTNNRAQVPLGVETWAWNPNQRKNWEYMFYNCGDVNGFNRDMSVWNPSGVTSIERMFGNNWSFNNGGQPLTWNFPITNSQGVSSTSARLAFSNCRDFVGAGLDQWDTSRISDFRYMFQMQYCNSAPSPNGGSFNQDLGDWDLQNIPTNGFMEEFLKNQPNLTQANLEATLIGWAKKLITNNNAGITPPTGVLLQIGFGDGCMQPNAISCTPAASGGPYTVPGDIVNVQDAVDYFTNTLTWAVLLDPCI